MNNLPRTSGIYKITCTANGKIYIGSSSDIARRWGDHYRKLNRGEHENPKLQHAWKKYGCDMFIVETLELCNVDALISREQHYLDALFPFDDNGYNIGRFAIHPAIGRKASAEARKNMSAAQKRRDPATFAALRMAQNTPETFAKIAASNTGKKVSAETKEKMVQSSRAKSYIVTSPSGERMTVRNLRKFCRENNLSSSGMSDVANGAYSNHRGWRCEHAD